MQEILAQGIVSVQGDSRQYEYGDQAEDLFFHS
jgi:hypothetical protein